MNLTITKSPSQEMVKFGERLASESYPPFSPGYVQYEILKHGVETSQSGFGEALALEVKRVSLYAEGLRSASSKDLMDLEARWKDLESWKRSSFPDLDGQRDKLSQDVKAFKFKLERVVDFVATNVVGVQKICKKHDRKSGEVSGPFVLTKLQRDAEQGYLDRLSNTTDLDGLVDRTIKLLREVEKMAEDKQDIKEIAPKDDKSYAIQKTSRSQSSASMTSSSSPSEIAGDLILKSLSMGKLDHTRWEQFLELIARPLLAVPRLIEPGTEEWVFAFTGAFLAGAGTGALWTYCELILNPWQVALTVLFSSLGSITGSRPALSSLYATLFLLAGALSALLFSLSPNRRSSFSTSKLALVWLWGVCVGAWTVQYPRQLVSSTTTSICRRIALTLAPLLGMSVGAGLTWYVMGFDTFAMLLCVGLCIVMLVTTFWHDSSGSTAEERARILVRTDSSGNQDNTMGSESEEDDEDLERSRVGSIRRPNSMKNASSTALTMGVLGSLAIDRTARTLIALLVTAFYPTIPNQDFFLLSLGSLASAFIGPVVPAWCCALLGWVSLFWLDVPGLIVWIWVEASYRSDLTFFPANYAGTADTISYVADSISAIIFILILSSYGDLTESISPPPVIDPVSASDPSFMPNEDVLGYKPQEVVTMVCGGLLFASSFGRMASSWILSYTSSSQ